MKPITLQQVLNDAFLWGKVFNFCLERGISVSPDAIGNNQIRLIVNNNGKRTYGKEIYTNENFGDKLREIYVHIYNKMNTNN